MTNTESGWMAIITDEDGNNPTEEKAEAIAGAFGITIDAHEEDYVLVTVPFPMPEEPYVELGSNLGNITIGA